MGAARPKLRLDKWHWHARFFRTHTLAPKQVGNGRINVNGELRDKKPPNPVIALWDTTGADLIFPVANRLNDARCRIS
ncbi:MAG: hypothetical protein GDA36_10755 [Rhodobacteraceae bacterium]|nr:hypothetical protein [Paracoccaceae bacterium]